jgi:hypothetical protein
VLGALTEMESSKRPESSVRPGRERTTEKIGRCFVACGFGLAALGVVLVVSPVGSANTNPPHGHWIYPVGGPVLVCDLTYYAAADACVQPLAFARAAGGSDGLPRAIAVYTSQARASRLIGQFRDPSRQAWRLYLTITSESRDPTRDPCLQFSRASSYWGSLCIAGTQLVSPGTPADWMMVGKVVVGVAPNSINQVDIVNTGKRSEPVALSRDHGFIYFCQSSCACTIRAIISRADGHVVNVDSLVDPTTHRLAWCE